MLNSKESGKTTGKIHQDVLHHGLFCYLETFREIFEALFPIEFKSNKEGRRYAIIRLPADQQIERHLTIDATYTHKKYKRTPCHLTRSIPLANGSAMIQHAHIVLADERGDAMSAFTIIHIDAKKKEASDTDYSPVTLTAIEQESIQHDVETLVRAKLYELYKHRNQYISERSYDLNAIDTELANYPCFYDNANLTHEQAQEILGLFTRQKAIYEELFPYEDYPLHYGFSSAGETLTSIINLLNDSLKRRSPIKQIQETTQSSMQISKSNTTNHSKAKSKTSKIKEPTDAELIELAKRIVSQLDACSEAQLCDLQVDILILSEHDSRNKQFLALVSKCDTSIAQKRAYFKTKKEQQLRLIESSLTAYEKTLAELEKIHSEHATTVNQCGESPSAEINAKNDEAYLETIIPLAGIIRQAQKELIALRIDQTLLTPELSHKKAALLAHSASLRIFGLINNYLKSWIQYAVFLKSVETIKYLLVTYPATRVILQDIESSYANILQQILVLTGMGREKLTPTQQKDLKNLVNMAYFCFENSNQYQAVFLKLEEHIASESLLNQQSIFHHATPRTSSEYISKILMICALNDHDDVFQLFITQGFELDRPFYSDVSRDFLVKLPKNIPSMLRFKKLLMHKMPELIPSDDGYASILRSNT